MKTKYLFIAGLALITAAAACNKNETVAEKGEALSDQEIVIAVDGDFSASVTTKGATVVDDSNLNTIKVSAIKASAFVDGFNNVTFTKDGGVFKGNKYWPETDGSWSFVAANTDMAGTYSDPYINAANASTDYIYGSATPSHKATTVPITMDHAFAQIGTVTMRAPAGYTVTGCSVTIAPITSGHIHVKTGAWSDQGSAGTPVYIFGGASGVAVTSDAGGTTSADNDLWLVPGTYTLTANYTIAKGDFTKAYTKTATVTLQQGKNNNIGLNGAGDANIPVPEDIVEINFTVTVTPWGTVNLPADFS